MALWIPQTTTVINGSNWDKRHFPLVNEVLKHSWNENTSKLTTHQVKFKTSKQQNNKNAQLKWPKGLPSILFCLRLDWTKSPINGPSQTFVLAVSPLVWCTTLLIATTLWTAQHLFSGRSAADLCFQISATAFTIFFFYVSYNVPFSFT